MSEEQLAQREDRAQGYISSIPIDSDFGFIEADSDGETLFFHQNWVVGRDFRDLQPGERCEDVALVLIDDDVAVIVVSDGAGSARYSAEGAAVVA